MSKSFQNETETSKNGKETIIVNKYGREKGRCRR